MDSLIPDELKLPKLNKELEFSLKEVKLLKAKYNLLKDDVLRKEEKIREYKEDNKNLNVKMALEK